MRGTALIEDGAGMGASALAVIPFVGYPAGASRPVPSVARVRRRDGQKYEGLRVLR